MRYLSIERFENNLAICEDCEKRMFAIEKGELPQGAKPGDVLSIDEEGNIKIDKEEAERRKKRILELQKKLFK